MILYIHAHFLRVHTCTSFSLYPLFWVAEAPYMPLHKYMFPYADSFEMQSYASIVFYSVLHIQLNNFNCVNLDIL